MFLLREDETPKDLIDRSLDHLLQRKFLIQDGETLRRNDAETDVLKFYAASLARNSAEFSAAAQ